MISKQNSKWREFSEAFTTFLQHTKGQCDFSLSYVIRAHDDYEELEGDLVELFESLDEYDEALAPLSGVY
jgi:hypothetical protein